MHSQMCSGYYLGKETGEKNSMTSAASIYIPSDSHLFNIRQVWSLEVKWPEGLRAWTYGFLTCSNSNWGVRVMPPMWHKQLQLSWPRPQAARKSELIITTGLDCPSFNLHMEAIQRVGHGYIPPHSKFLPIPLFLLGDDTSISKNPTWTVTLSTQGQDPLPLLDRKWSPWAVLPGHSAPVYIVAQLPAELFSQGPGWKAQTWGSVGFRFNPGSHFLVVGLNKLVKLLFSSVV